MALLKNDALLKNPSLRRQPRTAEEWTRFIQSLNEQEIASLVISADGFIRSGQTDYNTGTGWWIGDDNGTPKFSMGNPSGDYWTWNGSIIDTNGGVRFNQVDSFTPIWTGFSSDPTGDALFLNLGSIVIIWPEASSGSFSGTSDADTFVMAGLPAAACPPATSVPSTLGQAFDSAGNEMAVAVLGSDGTIRFDAQTLGGTSSDKVVYSSTGWATTGVKGWNGFLMFPIKQTIKSV